MTGRRPSRKASCSSTGCTAPPVARWYADFWLTPTPDGCIDQHYVCEVVTSGEAVPVPIYMVIALEGERFKWLEEYIEFEASGPVTAGLLRGG
jgi:hypothetical protein